MRFTKHYLAIVTMLVLIRGACLSAQTDANVKYPVVTAAPESFFEKVREGDREAARRFYKKYIDVNGMPVVASAEVADLALQRTYEIVTHMLAGRADIVKGLVDRGMYLVIIGANQVYTDLPEFKKNADANIDHTARFMDYSPKVKLLVVSQENVLGSLEDAYATECQIIRVFARALYHVTAMRPVDPDWENRGRNVQQYELRVQRMDIRFDNKLRKLYDSAMSRGLWKGTAAIHDRLEYWTAGVLAYFDAVGQGVPPNDAGGPVTTREKLAEYDPGLFVLVEETMAYNGKVDWRYTWRQRAS